MDDRYKNQVVLGQGSPLMTVLGLATGLLVVLGCTTAAFAGVVF